MISRIKKFFGIEGVKLELIIPEAVSAREGVVQGQIKFQSMNAQDVNYIKLVMIERYARGRGDKKMIDDYEIGIAEIDIDIDIPAEEAVFVDFELPFQLVKSGMDELEGRNFFVGGIVKAAKYLSKVKSEYRVVAEAKVKGTALNPFDQKNIQVR